MNRPNLSVPLIVRKVRNMYQVSLPGNIIISEHRTRQEALNVKLTYDERLAILEKYTPGLATQDIRVVPEVPYSEPIEAPVGIKKKYKTKG